MLTDRVRRGDRSGVDAAWPWHMSLGELASKGKAPEALAPDDSAVCSRNWSKSSSSTERGSSRDWSKSSSTAPSSREWSKPSSTQLLGDSGEQVNLDTSTDASPRRHGQCAASDGPETWPPVARPQFGVAVVRHAERADEAWDSRWLHTEESKRHPFDPPITAKGCQQAEQVARVLYGAGGFHRVVSSPYLRCVQTALVIAERLDLPVELDHELGEIYGPTIFGQEPASRPWRSHEELKRALGDLLGAGHPSLARICPDSLAGRMPQWPEAPCEARRRCASSFQRYVQQARETEWGCVLVSHTYMVQASLSAFPPTSAWTLASIGYCATLMCHFRSPATEDAGAEPDPAAAAAAVPQQECGEEASPDFDVVNFRTLHVKVADQAGSPRRLVAKARLDQGSRRACEESLVKDLGSVRSCALSALRRRSDLAVLDVGGSSLARRRGLEPPMGKSLSENPGGSSLARRRGLGLGLEVPMCKSFSE